jgi:pimeloyl-ACP methyl ester carboxylesterase
MSTYVLIHGAWHGGWCWDKVVPILEGAGHRVLAPDLPGFGGDRRPLSEVSLHTWTDWLCGVLDALSEPVILVGHSRGGIVISQAAEYRPGKIRMLVYLTAFLLPNGVSLSEAGRDDASLVGPNLVPSDDHASRTIRLDAVEAAFYSDCPAEDIARAKELLAPEPNGPGSTPMRISEANFGRVPRIYIECLHDRAISIAFQRNMCAKLPCSRVITMNTSHSPFFSAPQELAENLMAL